jgi:hypothetical protein
MPIIPRRFNGPPASGNGGYVGGLLAMHLSGLPAGASVEVTLRAPPPLDAELDTRVHGEGVALFHGDTLLAEARAAEFDLMVPSAPSAKAAAAAGAIGRLRARARPADPYRHCFGCGIARDDGLRIVPSPVGEDGVVASDWTPDPALADAEGGIPLPIVWAALDCPAGFAWTNRLGDDSPTMMTGRMAARIDLPLRAGERYIAIGWPIRQEGRKLHAGTALIDGQGTVRARSLQLWLQLRG